MNEKRISLLEAYNVDRSVLDSYLRDSINLTRGRLCYGIHNLKLDKWYIGSTVCGIQLRFWKCFSTGHFYQVSQGTHKFLTLNNLEEFELVILEEFDKITKTELRKVESKYIAIYDSFNSGYNDTPSAQAGFYGKHHSEESRKKTSDTLSRTNKLPEVSERRRSGMRRYYSTINVSEVQSKRSKGKKKHFSDPDTPRLRASGRTQYYSYSSRKCFFRRPDELDELKKEFPDIRKGNPQRSYDKTLYENWWEDPKWIPND